MTNTMKKTNILMILLILVLMLALIPGKVFASLDDQDRISIATSEPVYVYWSSSTTDTGVVTKVDSSSSYYPSSFFLYVDSTYTPTINNGGSITAMSAYDTSYGKAYEVTLPTGSTSTITTRLSTYDDNSGYYYLTCSAPAGSLAGSATLPTYDDGYLPVGQFASGSSWGSIFSDGTNLTGTTKKFLSGYTSTGVSLGACGGYVQYDFGSSPIGNNNTNPYGVDFVVYGNAFNGNPEAGSVMVSNDGTNWYELAGSNYYNTSTLKNVNVTYKKITTTDSTFTSTGVWYKITNSSNATITDWTLFKNATAWWPEYTSEGYGSVWNTDSNLDNVTWDTTNNEITYSGVTLLTDSDTTNYYPYGYVDVRANGTATGNAINPYGDAPASSSGGAGFDLAWAVNPSTGAPVSLSSVKYVRVYTSAGLNAASNALVVGTFGETSTEVTGIYSTANVSGSSVGTTSVPDITINDTDLSDLTEDTIANLAVVTVTGIGSSSCSLNATLAGANLYFNDTRATSGTASTITGIPTTGYKYVRVIAQTGTAQPYILILKLQQ